MAAPRFWPLVVLALCLTAGCTSPREYWQAIRGEGFPEWSENMNTGTRGDTSQVKPSGFFFDRKAEQIEQRLGGGF